MNPEKIFTKGSKSFSLAARFFPRDLQIGAIQIYHWCRFVDDVVDEKKGNIEEVQVLTSKVWNSDEPLDLPYESLRAAALKYQIPETYAQDLLKGMIIDSKNQRFQDLSALKYYCYCVASTVGLMMSHVIGLFHTGALAQAAELGIAMQLTNIARDIKEDYVRGRIYLPKEWLKEMNLSESHLYEDTEKLFELVKRLIHESELYYEKGRSGISELPLRGAIAVTLASLFYREIGREILRQKERALFRRTVVSKRRKLMLTLQGLGEILLSLPRRFVYRRKVIQPNVVWRPYELC